MQSFRFSHRMGKTPVDSTCFQYYSMDADFEKALTGFIVDKLGASAVSLNDLQSSQDFWQALETTFGTINAKTGLQKLQIIFTQNIWQAYDLLEFVLSYLAKANRHYYTQANDLLEAHQAGYRFDFSGQLQPIIAEEIVISLRLAQYSHVEMVNQKLQQAYQWLSDASDPDYANSIKAALGAVKAIGFALTGKRLLGQQLAILQSEGFLDQAMEKAWHQIFAYANQSGNQLGSDKAALMTKREALLIWMMCVSLVHYLNDYVKL